MQKQPDNWWGDYHFKTAAVGQWEIGPLQIAVQRLAREWLVACDRVETTEENPAWHFAFSDDKLMPDGYSEISRFVSERTGDHLTVLPGLADRSVVSRPLTPFTVPGGERATIYISTPLWFTLVADPASQALFEVPIQRPSDTWFGPSTQEGETCYASRTYARLNLENVVHYPHRAITEVHINNNAMTPLFVERLNLPVPYLSPFHTPEGIIWTETVNMVQTRGTSLVEFNIENAPQSASEAQLLAPPRRGVQKGMLIRAFSALKLQGFD